MKMNSRIEDLIKNLDIKKVDFARRLKIDQSYVTKLIKGDNLPSERLIDNICSEFNVNEVWLRTGEGGDDNMFTKASSKDRFSISLGKLTMTENEFIQNAINAFAETEPEKLKIVEEFMKKCLGIK